MTKEEIEKKRQKELNVSTLMIEIYCKGNKHGSVVPCEDCKELIEYAKMRIAKCPFMESKTYCSNCKVHCYKPEMRHKIRKVMRYAGPRMLFHHPFMAIDHVIQSLKQRHQREDKK